MTASQANFSVTGLFLVDTNTGRDLAPLSDNLEINLNEYPDSLTIRATVSSDVQITKASIDGSEINRNARNTLSLNGKNSDGSFIPYSFQEGRLAVSFQPMKRVNGSWVSGTTRTLSLNFVRKEKIGIASLSLVDTVTGQVIRKLVDGSVIDLFRLGSNLTIVADPQGLTEITISTFNGQEVSRLARPSLSLSGEDERGRLLPHDFPLGKHYVEFTPAAKINDVWERGEPYGINLTVTETLPSIASGNQVLALMLVDAESGEDLRRLREIDLVDLNQYKMPLTVRAITSDDVMITIATVNGLEAERLARPTLTLAGKDGERFLPYPFVAGEQQIQFTPSKRLNDGSWVRGQTFSVTLEVKGSGPVLVESPIVSPPTVQPAPSPTPVVEPAPVVDSRTYDLTLSRNFAYSQFVTTSSHANRTINAEGSRWDFATSKVPEPSRTLHCSANNPSGPNLPLNAYPIRLEHRNVGLYKPLLDGDISLTAPWGPAYCNGAGIMLTNANGSVIDGARLSRMWDGFRMRGDSNGFMIRNTWISDSRDDCIENDLLSSGTVRDSLFDGCFVGISMRPGAESGSLPTGINKVLTLDGLLMRVKGYWYMKKDGRDFGIGSGHAFKIDSRALSLAVHNTIIAYDTPQIHIAAFNLLDMIGRDSKRLKSCSNNQVLWMHNDNPPAEFRQLHSCFQLHTGQRAREIWANARNQWIQRHPVGITRRLAGDR